MAVMVKFTSHELLIAGMAGVQRRVAAIEKGRPAYHGADDRPDKTWSSDIGGVMGEMAVSKALQMFWNPAATDGNLAEIEGDVGKLQVRSSYYATAHLIMYEYDKPEAPYILALVREPWVKLCGWVRLEDAMRVGDPRPSKTHMCYWVEQHHLRDMDELGPIAYDGHFIKRKDSVTNA
jgi:hypothetical protein